jgi:hypothetical protein
MFTGATFTHIIALKDEVVGILTRKSFFFFEAV